MENLIFSLIVFCSRTKGYGITYAYLKSFEIEYDMHFPLLAGQLAGIIIFLFPGNWRAKKKVAVFQE